MQLNIHSILWGSKANGPGIRAVVWFQGCSIQCQGCFNPATHSFQSMQLLESKVLAGKIIGQGNKIEGITISGGEPFDQPQGLSELLDEIRNFSKLSVILLTGYPFEKIVNMPEGPEILKNVDVLIAGPFQLSNLQPQNLAGSSNKTHHFLTPRYSINDFGNIPDSEVIIDSEGNITYSGIKGL